MVALPALTAVTKPVWLTVATGLLELAQTSVAPAGFEVPVSCDVAPTASAALDGETVTFLTLVSEPPPAPPLAFRTERFAGVSTAVGVSLQATISINVTATMPAMVFRISMARKKEEM